MNEFLGFGFVLALFAVMGLLYFVGGRIVSGIVRYVKCLIKRIKTIIEVDDWYKD